VNQAPMVRDLRKMVRGQVLAAPPLAAYTSLRIGGPADALVICAGEGDVCRVLRYANRQHIACHVVGAGTNLLVPDEGVRGIVLHTGRLDALVFNATHIRAGAGCGLRRLVGAALRRRLGGVEFLAGIPGTVGGAVVMNAGAYGRYLSDVFVGARCAARDGAIVELTPAKAGFGYRHSRIPRLGLVVLAADLRLEPGDPADLRRAIRADLRRRRQRQPLQLPSAGSVFRNPPGGYAARLIEQAGGKGLRCGGAMVSELHANFIVNTGDAAARDVLTLIARVQTLVKQKFGVDLEPEVRVLGQPEVTAGGHVYDRRGEAPTGGGADQRG